MLVLISSNAVKLIDFYHYANSRSLSRAVKLVESIKKSTGPNLNEALPLPAKYESLLRLFDYTEVVSFSTLWRKCAAIFGG